MLGRDFFLTAREISDYDYFPTHIFHIHLPHKNDDKIQLNRVVKVSSPNFASYSKLTIFGWRFEQHLEKEPFLQFQFSRGKNIILEQFKFIL